MFLNKNLTLKITMLPPPKAKGTTWNMLASLGLRWWQHYQFQRFFPNWQILGTLHIAHDPLISEKYYPVSIISKYNF